MALAENTYQHGGPMTSTVGAAVLAVVSAAESKGARVGLSAVLPDGGRVGHREHEVFKAASTIKIAIMVELFRRVDAGDLSLDQPYVLRSEDKTPGTGVLREFHPGVELTLQDVLHLMMSISDNTATNILIDHVGIDAVNTAMRDLGLRDSVLGRRMYGRPAEPGERENLATPSELALLTAAILDGTAASAQSCADMLEALRTQTNNRRIGRYVPAGAAWGSKTGTYPTAVSDVGFVMAEDGPLIVSAFVEDIHDVVEGEAVISSITRELLA